jgi:8-amino-7-oxononanoate synthase
MEVRLQDALDRRQSDGTRRSLQSVNELGRQEKSSLFIDFSSNDYLGLARCRNQQSRVDKVYKDLCRTTTNVLGATGSRLLSGDSYYCRRLEEWLARLHNRPAALICNSGYDANLCFTSCLPVTVVIMDELCHNSINMGVRWSSRQKDTLVTTFLHNNVEDLELKLQADATDPSRVVVVIVESVYSMDGDVAPLAEILDICNNFGAQVVVDEAHGLGIYGRTNRQHVGLQQSLNDTDGVGVGGTGVLAALELESHPALLASVHTFGKAAGCHGAIICCSSDVLKDYLLNYARPFIYSTALPLHSLVTIRCSYATMIGSKGGERRLKVFNHVALFRQLVENMMLSMDGPDPAIRLCPSDSPIQALLVPGNDDCIHFCHIMKQNFDILLYPIRTPTVPRGQERVRIILHSHNTTSHVIRLVKCMGKTLRMIHFENASMKSRL